MFFWSNGLEGHPKMRAASQLAGSGQVLFARKLGAPPKCKKTVPFRPPIMDLRNEPETPRYKTKPSPAARKLRNEPNPLPPYYKTKPISRPTLHSPNKPEPPETGV